jgi:hypothetical protein
MVMENKNSRLWQFDKISIVSNITFDHTLQDFYSFGVSGLVRENIQNSLGARLSDSLPVKVTIKMGTHSKEDVPNFSDIEDRISSLQSRNDYTSKILNNMKANLDNEIYNYLSFEDENTSGLKHGVNGSDIYSSSYASYAYGQGAHYEDSEDHDKAKGGSHGIGKIASNSASIFNIMFFANVDENGLSTLGGTVELIDHSFNQQPYRGKGFFTNVDVDGNYNPIKNVGYKDIFCKSTRGLKVIVPFVYEEFIDEDEIIRTVCDTFFYAILSNSLEVTINEKVINKETLNQYVYNSKYFDLEIENIRDRLTPLYIKTLASLYCDDFKIPSNNNMYHFTLMLIKDDRIRKGRTAIVRRIGMKIEDHGVTGFKKSPYNAVLLCNSKKEDDFLVTLENVSHTELSEGKLTDANEKSDAKRFLSQLDTKLAEVITQILRDETDSTLDINTEDILNYNENKFEHDLHKRMSVINLGSGTQHPKVVKIDDTEEDGKSKKINKGHKKGTKVNRVKKKFGNKGTKYYFQIKNSSIHRVVHSKKETIEIDLTNDEHINEDGTFNLLLTIVDGRGVEHYNIVNLKDIYSKIEDNNSYIKLVREDYMVKGVTIKNGKIKLSFYMKESIMNNKYRMYLEE